MRDQRNSRFRKRGTPNSSQQLLSGALHIRNQTSATEFVIMKLKYMIDTAKQKMQAIKKIF